MSTYPQEILEHLKRVEKLTDRLGKPVDEGIKLLVAALWAHDFTTSNSCGGHEDRRNGGPFVEIQSPDALSLERRIYGKVPVQDEAEKSKLLHELKLLNLAEEGYLLSWLNDFYENRKSDIWVRLVVQGLGNGRSKIMCQGARYIDAFKDDDERLQWLEQAKQEFADFTQFLVDELGTNKENGPGA